MQAPEPDSQDDPDMADTADMKPTRSSTYQVNEADHCLGTRAKLTNTSNENLESRPMMNIFIS